jgi:hypothetical protein
MAKRGLTAEQYCDLLEKIIKRLGPKAYQHSGLIVLYSGPSDDIKRLLSPIFTRTNWHLSKDQAERTGGVRLDETVIGRGLTKRGLLSYFLHSSGCTYLEARRAANAVWVYASREFVRTAFKHAATAACGADENRVLRRHELRIAIHNPVAETINGVPVAHIRAAYERGGEYAAFRKICQAELTLSRQWVRDAKPAAERIAALEDYRARRKFFIVERQQTIRGAIHPPLGALSALSGIHSSILSEDVPLPPATGSDVSHPRVAGSHPH